VAILQGGRLVAVDTPDQLARRVGESSGIVVRIDGPADDVRAALAVIPGVRAVELVDGAASGPGVVLRISADDTAPVQRAIGGVVVPRGWALLEVRAETPTLEDLFMRLVG